MKKAYTNTIGCIETLHDENSIQRLLKQNGWEISADPSEAEILIFHTCGYRIKECLEKIAFYQRVKHPLAELIICGCLPAMAKDQFQEAFSGRHFGPKQHEELAQYLKLRSSSVDNAPDTFSGDIFYSPQRLIGANPFIMKLTGRVSDALTKIDTCFHTSLKRYFHSGIVFWFDTTMAYIKVATGCMGQCTYCAIRYAKGRITSVAEENILAEFRYGLAHGKKEFVLCGEDVGAYGQDIGMNIVHLLDAMLKTPGDYTIHIHYMDPRFLIRYFTDLCRICSTGKIGSMCIPVQSGSNRILKLMKKRFNAERFEECARHISRHFPWILLRTHVIVGFPQETDQDFALTCALLLRLSFNQVSVFEYQQVPHNDAAAMEGQVPDKIKADRVRRLKLQLVRKKCCNVIPALLFCRAAEKQIKRAHSLQLVPREDHNGPLIA